jgi:hypothetical protein
MSGKGFASDAIPVISPKRRTDEITLRSLLPILPVDHAFPSNRSKDLAAAHVRPRSAAVGEQVGVIAAGVFQGVGEDRQAVEGKGPSASVGEGMKLLPV